MRDKAFLLDTSALLAFIEKEPGADRVLEILRGEEVIIPWTALLEVVYITRQERGESEALVRYALLTHMRARIAWEADEPTVLTAARLKAAHRLSLADAIIAAFAIRHGATLVHKDPEYDCLQGQADLEALPYKTASKA